MNFPHVLVLVGALSSGAPEDEDAPENRFALRLQDAVEAPATPAAEAGEAGPAPARKWSLRGYLVGHRYFAADLDDSPGHLSIARLGLRVGASRTVDRKRSFGVFGRFEESFYDFGDGARISGFDGVSPAPRRLVPADDVALAGLAVSLTTRETPDLSWTLVARTNVGFEPGADVADALVYGGGATVTFRAFSDFLVTVGGFGSTRLEDDPLFFPWFQLDWEPTEKLKIGGQEGGGYGVGYKWLEDTTTYLNVSFVERQYRLRDDGVLPSGVLRDSEFALNTGVIYQPGRFRAELFGGFAFRRINVQNDGNTFFGDDETDIGPYLGLSLSYGL